MIVLTLHWLASWVVLSVVLAHLENINILTSPFRWWLPRVTGWALLGGAAFDGIIAPVFGHGCAADRLGLIGFGLLAVAYRWEGASRYEGVRRRANDH